MSYLRFFAMIGTSTLIMFGLMYLNTYALGHIFFSETRAYMAVLMGAVMAIVMLLFMLSMYKNRAANVAILAGSVLVFAGSLWLVRSQVTVQDLSYLRAMIPHHSIAIMTSTRAELTDPRVRHLADDIIYAQDKEIAEMRYLVATISENGEETASIAKAPAELRSAEDALQTETLGNIDPEFLTPDDITAGLPGEIDCTFAYTVSSRPVLVIDGSGTGLIKISGDLVRLNLEDRGPEGLRLTAPPIELVVAPTDEDGMGELTISAGEAYSAGFHGPWSCG